MPAEPGRVAILSAVRTPIGKFGGALRSTPAVRLGVITVVEALRRAHVTPSDIPELLFGQSIQAGAGQNPARQVLLGSGGSVEAGAATVNMVCGSAMKSIILAAAEIESRQFPIAVAGGMENMSQAPYLLPAQVRWGTKLGSVALDDAMMRDSLLDAYGEHLQMGQTGERIAAKFQLKREEVDAYALRSHLAAARARDDGTFAQEVVPVPAAETPGARGLERDEGPRGDSTPEGLRALKPVFEPNGVLTAGNSAQLSDGAAAVVLASEEEARRRGATPLAWIHSSQVSGVAPLDVMEAPIPTVRAHLKRTGFSPAEFDRVEHNEAFSSASVVVQRTFGFTEGQFNVHGGAVALGHPIGASGCRIVVTLLHELVRANGRLGLATLCMGGGNGLSMILDRRDL